MLSYLSCLYELLGFCFVFFFFKQKTAYEMRISDWSSDVCSSDLSVQENEMTKQMLAAMATELALIAATPAIAQQGGSTVTAATTQGQIGRASCRERVCQYV